MIRNLPTIRSIAADPGVLIGLPIDTLSALIEEAEAENKLVSAAKRAICAQVEKVHSLAISAAYQAQGKDFGTVRVSDGGFEVVVDTPKRVEWSQDVLLDIRAKIAASGDNPGEYIKTTLSVDERAYAAWPEHIRKTFEPARTVKPGPRTIKIVRKEAA